jgi:tetratricopeptide (TPR) repeat protein
VPWALLAILSLALVVRAIVLGQLADHPLLQPIGGLDSEYYVRLARDLAEGRPPSSAFFVSPLYVYFLAATFAIGGTLMSARVIQILLGTAAVGLVYATGRRWFGEMGSGLISVSATRRDRAGWIGGTLAALTGIFAFYEVTILQAALDPFLTALTLYLVTRAVQDAHWGWCAASGGAIALHALNRPNVLPYLGVVCLLLLLPRPSRAAFGRVALVLAGAAIVIAPVAIRNSRAEGELVLVSSHGGLNFYIGNHADADGTYQQVPGITPSIAGQAQDAERVAEAAVRRDLRASEVSDYFYGQAWAWIAAHPLDALALFARKLLYVVNATPIALNYSVRYYSGDESTLLRALVVGPWLLVPLGLAGLVFGVRRRPPGYLVWAAFVPVYAVSVAAFFVSDRYRLPLLVPLCAASGATGVTLWEAYRHRHTARLAATLTLVGALALPANVDLGLDDGRAAERTEMILHYVDARQDEAAMRLLARAEPDHRQPALLLYRVGQAYARRGDAPRAILLLERARKAEPGRVEVDLALGQALLDAGRPAEALPLLRSAVRAGHQRDVAAFDLARALAATGARQDAVAALSSIPSNRGDAASLVAVGRLALDLGDAGVATRFLSAAAAVAPDNAEAHESLGLALGVVGRSREAVAALETALRLDPLSPKIRLNLAVLCAQLGRVDEARRHAEEALRLQPDYARARELLAALRRGR